jgi:hypothetical protein
VQPALALPAAHVKFHVAGSSTQDAKRPLRTRAAHFTTTHCACHITVRPRRSRSI